MGIIEESGFLSKDGHFFRTTQELAEYNRLEADDWSEWREAEYAAEKGLEYARNGRI